MRLFEGFKPYTPFCATNAKLCKHMDSQGIGKQQQLEARGCLDVCLLRPREECVEEKKSAQERGKAIRLPASCRQAAHLFLSIILVGLFFYREPLTYHMFLVDLFQKLVDGVVGEGLERHFLSCSAAAVPAVLSPGFLVVASRAC